MRRDRKFKGLMAVGLISFAGLNANSGFAASDASVVRFLENELTRIEDAVAEDEVQEVANLAQERWDVQSFMLRLRTPLEFKVPLLAKLEITPQFELVLQRPAPKGWTAYKP